MSRHSRAGRPVNTERVAALHQLILTHPGRRAGWYAAQLGLTSADAPRLLLSAERVGVLLSEDDRGRLYPHGE